MIDFVYGMIIKLNSFCAKIKSQYRLYIMNTKLLNTLIVIVLLLASDLAHRRRKA